MRERLIGSPKTRYVAARENKTSIPHNEALLQVKKKKVKSNCFFLVTKAIAFIPKGKDPLDCKKFRARTMTKVLCMNIWSFLSFPSFVINFVWPVDRSHHKFTIDLNMILECRILRHEI